tara:strand:- start:295 stop:1149 length:855 start_codon:yes stop_codon:yes gene_type:complete
VKIIKKIIGKVNSYIFPPWNSPQKKTSLNLLTTFSSFKPHGNQDYESFVPLVVKNINETIPKIAQIAEFEDKNKILNYSIFYDQKKHKNTEKIQDNLSKNLDLYGSDKVRNNYHLIYSCILNDIENPYNILEIGLGTNNPKIVSSMGVNGKPGASIKGFRDTFPSAKIYGADVDKKILFSEERIKTFFVDQNILETFKNITDNVKEKFDLIIDDGLHFQLSNLNTLLFALNNLQIDGFFIIEDIGVWTIDTWKIVNKLIPKNFESQIIEMSENNFVFLLQKKNI